jgi:secreted trypsin-like serine protease
MGAEVKFYKLALNFVFSLTLFACNQDQSAHRVDPKAREKKSPGVCVAEKILMAPNIVGGELVNKGDGDEKTVVMLMGLESGSICTAAPIAKDVLVTAAHCVGEDPNVLAAAFYPSISCESGFNMTKHTLRVSRIARHSGYDLSIPVDKRKDDIALVFLKQDIPIGYPIYKIADPQQVNESHDMYLYGYGVTGENRGGAGMLRKTTVRSNQYNIQQNDKKVRVDQANSAGFCMGDSGGPGMVKINGELQILGVNSYVQGRDGDICNKLGFQTLVDSYKDWINFQMN